MTDTLNAEALEAAAEAYVKKNDGSLTGCGDGIEAAITAYLAALPASGEVGAVACSGRPTPDEAAATLRRYARKQNLWPNDNDFDDAANVITALQARVSELEDEAEDFEGAKREWERKKQAYLAQTDATWQKTNDRANRLEADRDALAEALREVQSEARDLSRRSSKSSNPHEIGMSQGTASRLDNIARTALEKYGDAK